MSGGFAHYCYLTLHDLDVCKSAKFVLRAVYQVVFTMNTQPLMLRFDLVIC